MSSRTIYFDIAMMCTLGVCIGFIFCRRWFSQVSFSVVLSILYVVIAAWISGTLSNEISIYDLSGTFDYIGIPYLCFYLLPITFTAILSGWFRRRRLNKPTQ